MQKNPIPGNVLTEVSNAFPGPVSVLPTDFLKDRLYLLVGGQDNDRRQEQRFLTEVGFLRDEIQRRHRQAQLESELESEWWGHQRTPDRWGPLTMTLAPVQGDEQPPSASITHDPLDAAVEALNGFTGYEDNLRAQATEILLGLVPTTVEEAFTALMWRAERWNEED